MKRHLSQALRASATVAGAAAGMLVLSYTGQTSDGFIHTTFTGPLGLFGPDSVEQLDDVMAIGDGPNDATELASLLKISAPTANAAEPYRVSVASGSTPKTNQLSVFPTATPVPNAGVAPTAEQALTLEAAPAVDALGRVDCRGTVSCELDPRTNVTTVTYSDGTVATVQHINDMTLVAYKTVNDKVQNQLKSIVPTTTVPSPMAAVPAPKPPPILASVPTPATPPPPQSPAVEPTPVVNPGPAVTPTPTEVPGLSASTVRPRVTVSRAPQDFNPVRTGPATPARTPTSIAPPPGVSEAIEAVKDAVDSVVGAVGKAINPGSASSNQAPAPN